MRKKARTSSRKNIFIGAAALILVLGSFSIASGDVLSSSSSMLAAAVAAISGKPTLIISRSSDSPSGTIPTTAVGVQTLAVFNVAAKNVTHWATLQNISGQVVVTAPLSSWLGVNTITLEYRYCIPAGKTYGYGWQGGNCAVVSIPATLAEATRNKVTGLYTFNFNSSIPVYPQASPSTLVVKGVPMYAYTGSAVRSGSADGKFQVQLVNISATGDQCTTVKVAAKGTAKAYGYSKCITSNAEVNIVNNGNTLTASRPYGYGYRGVLAAMPTLTLTASPDTIASGKSSTIAWSSTGATSCISSGSSIPSDIRLSGSAVVSPLKSAVYIIACSGKGGTVTKSVTVTVGNSTATGPLTVVTDATSPSYKLVAGGSVGVPLGVYKFHAGSDSVNLTKIGLVLTSGKAADITSAYVYSNTKLVGTATFTGNSQSATVLITSPLTIPANSDIVLTLKGDIGNIGKAQPATSGDVIKVDVNSAEGVNQKTNALVPATGSTNVAGVRIFKSSPAVTLGALPSTGVQDGRLLRFQIAASPSGTVGLGKMTFGVKSPSTTIQNVKLYAYTDSGYSNPAPGLIGGETPVILTNGGYVATPSVEVPAGITYYFELRATVKGTSAVATTLYGDTAAVSLAPFIALSANQNFIWSPNDISMSSVSDSDWVNGYGISGLPIGGGITQTRAQ